MSEIGCDEALRLIHLLHDGEPVDPATRAAVETHCETCAGCAGARDEVAALGALLREAVPGPLPPELVARFEARLAAEDARERWNAEVLPFARTLTRIAAAVAVVAGLSAAAVVRSSLAPRPMTGTATEAEPGAAAEDYLYGELALNADAVADVALGGHEELGGSR